MMCAECRQHMYDSRFTASTGNSTPLQMLIWLLHTLRQQITKFFTDHYDKLLLWSFTFQTYIHKQTHITTYTNTCTYKHPHLRIRCPIYIHSRSSFIYMPENAIDVVDVVVCAHWIRLFVFVRCSEMWWCAWAWMTVCAVRTHAHSKTRNTITHIPTRFQCSFIIIYLRASFAFFFLSLFYFKSKFTEKIFSRVPQIGIFTRPLRRWEMFNLQFV